MPANIENFARRSGSDRAWHNLGNTFNADDPIEVKLEKAGMLWTVDSSPVYYNAAGQAKVASDKQLFYRSDMPENVLGIMGKDFQPVQPKEVLEFFEVIADETGTQLDTAGVLQGGARFWAQADVQESHTVGENDRIQNRLLIATANDGTLATSIKPCYLRVVCQNTWTAAMRENTEAFRVTHRSKVDWKKAREWVLNERTEFALYSELMDELKKIPVNASQAIDFSKELIAPDWDGKTKAPRNLNRFAHTLQSGIGQQEAGANAYGLINAVTRYVDHDKIARSEENRINASWFGLGASLKSQALDILLKNCVEKWGNRDQLVPVLRETKYSDLAA